VKDLIRDGKTYCAADRQTLAATDLLVPSIGEIIGGSQREERLEKLCEGLALQHLKERPTAGSSIGAATDRCRTPVSAWASNAG
jgi:hypothetical protein